MKLSKMATLAAAGVLALTPLSMAQQNQPEMESALQHLREAEQDLMKASHDKGGHRAQAIGLINQAERQIQEGIQFDNQHVSAGESGYGAGNNGLLRITSGPTVEDVTDHSAVITWSTNIQGSSRVEYGTSASNLTE